MVGVVIILDFMAAWDMGMAATPIFGIPIAIHGETGIMDRIIPGK